MKTKTPRTGRPRIFSADDTGRTCGQCKVEKDASHFLTRKDGVLLPYCAECRKERRQEWYQSHLSPADLQRKEDKTSLESYSKMRAKLLASFGNTCQQCGYTKCLTALHFHHIDSSEKKTWFHSYYRSLREVEAHPERFQLLCANCHTELHHPAA